MVLAMAVMDFFDHLLQPALILIHCLNTGRTCWWLLGGGFRRTLVSSAWTFQGWVSLYYWVGFCWNLDLFISVFLVMVDRGLNFGRFLICFIGLIWEFRFCGCGFIMVIEEENRRKKGCLSVYEYIGTFEWGLWHCIQAAN